MIVKNKYIPFKGFIAMAIWPVIFVRKDKVLKQHTINHEKIHFMQQIEHLLIGFYVWYLIEFFYKWYVYKNKKKAYKNISFEKEANKFENNIDYLKYRKLYSSLKYL